MWIVSGGLWLRNAGRRSVKNREKNGQESIPVRFGIVLKSETSMQDIVIFIHRNTMVVHQRCVTALPMSHGDGILPKPGSGTKN